MADKTPKKPSATTKNENTVAFSRRCLKLPRLDLNQ